MVYSCWNVARGLAEGVYIVWEEVMNLSNKDDAHCMVFRVQ